MSKSLLPKPEKRTISAHGEKVRANRGKLVSNDQEAFEEYYRTRNLQKVSRKYGISRAGVKKHSVKAQWKARAATRDARVRVKADESIADMIAKDSVTMYKTLTLGNQQAVRHLRNPSLSTRGFDQTMSGMDKVIKGKRLIAGETTENAGQLTVADMISAARSALVSGKEDKNAGKSKRT